MAKVVVGLFPDRVSAEHALVDLRASGFDTQRMGLAMRDPAEARETGAGHGVTSTAGAVTGGVIGGTLGAILAATGTLVIPGIGPFIAGGVLATALAGGAAGWLVGGLVGLGLPHEEAQYYQGRVEQGGVLITVDPQGRDEEARHILVKNGAENLDAAPTAARAQPERTAAPRMMREEPRQPVQPARDRPTERGQTPVDRETERNQGADRLSQPDTRMRDDQGDVGAQRQRDAYETDRAQRPDDIETTAPRGGYADDDELVDRARGEEADDATAPRRRPAMDEDIIAEREDVPPRG